MKSLSLIALIFFQWFVAASALVAPSAGAALSGPPGATVRFSGPISDMGPMRWVVAGQPARVDGFTKIVAPDGTPASGMYASVTAQWQPGQELHASLLETRLTPFPLQAGPRYFSGIVDEILPDTWVIAGQPVAIDRSTLVVGEPFVGAFAVARVTAGPAARVIVVAAAGMLPLFVEGEILSISAGGWLVEISGGSWFVQVPDSAFVDGRPVVGASVHLMAQPEQNGSLQALYASIEDQASSPSLLSGRLLAKIDGEQPEQWLLLRDGDGSELSTATVVVDRQSALIDERYGPAVAGAWLEVVATPLPLAFDGWAARRVLVAGGPQDSVEGVIESVSGGPDGAVVRVAGQDVILDGGTQLDGRPRTGRYALVRGSRHASNTLWAAQMDVRYRFNGTLVERIFHGTVETWVISVQIAESGIDTFPQARVYLLVDHSTLVDPTLQNASAGVAVSVQARAADGGWVGDWIDEPRM